MLSKTKDEGGEALIKNNAVRERLADWFCEANGLKFTKFRTISALSKGEAPGPEASITKIVSANKLQSIGNFGIDSGDMAGMLIDGDSDFQELLQQPLRCFSCRFLLSVLINSYPKLEMNLMLLCQGF